VPVAAQYHAQSQEIAVSIVRTQTSNAHRNRRNWQNEEGEGQRAAEYSHPSDEQEKGT
jgi:hypothetical protein